MDNQDRRRRHAARMFEWEDQVAADATGKRQATAQRLVKLLRQKVDSSTGSAQADQKWLATKLGVTVTGVQKALAWLRRRNHLESLCRKHRHLHNLYTPILQSEQEQPKPTGVGIGGDERYEPELVVETNWRAQETPTAVGTSTHVGPSKDSGSRRARTFQSSRDDWRAGVAKLEDDIAADDAASPPVEHRHAQGGRR
jgi:hypothetical protein